MKRKTNIAPGTLARLGKGKAGYLYAYDPNVMKDWWIFGANLNAGDVYLVVATNGQTPHASCMLLRNDGFGWTYSDQLEVVIA